jgi:hypothetical protein
MISRWVTDLRTRATESRDSICDENLTRGDAGPFGKGPLDGEENWNSRSQRLFDRPLRGASLLVLSVHPRHLVGTSQSTG